LDCAVCAFAAPAASAVKPATAPASSDSLMNWRRFFDGIVSSVSGDQLKEKVIVLITFTGTPSSSFGLNFQPRAALTAASLSSGWPDMARAEMTLPASSTVTSTTTSPETLVTRANGGV